MKILQIRFRNLNSLAGEWTIDFTHPDYAANGIFAITGPTGSGKTTLLDAICLALYGRTPRLDRITETINEIMSRHTGLCFSEVVFETNKGRFRCHWSQRRARQQPNGKLQSPRHEIVDDRTDQVLESKLKDVARMVAEVTGMDFNQFTRSVLLAQGGFAAFLQASSDERAPILEQITGTEIYSRLSQKVHQRKGEEQHRFALLEAETGAVTLLTVEEEEMITTDLSVKKKSGLEIQEHIVIARNNLSWHANLQTLKSDIAALEVEAEEIGRKLGQAEPERLRLERAQKVQALDGNYRQLCRLRILQEKEGAETEKSRLEQATIDLQLKEMQTRREEAETLFHSADTAYQHELTLCKEVREMDIKLREAGTRAETVLHEHKTAENELHTHAGLQQQLQTLIAGKNAELEKTREYLLLHVKDAGLTEDLAGLQELVKTVTGQVEKARALRKEMNSAQETVRKAADLARQAMETHKKNCQSHADADSRYQILLQQVTARLAGRDPAFLREELENQTERRHALEKTGQLTRQLKELEAGLEADAGRQQETTAHLEERNLLRQSLAEKIALQKQMVEKQEQIVLLANRIRSYDEERAHLADGSPCPLCGAIVHPFVTHSLVRPEEAEPSLHRDREVLLQLQTRAADLQADIATADEKLKQVKITLEKGQLLLKQVQKEYVKVVGTLSLLPEDIETELGRIEVQRQECKNFLQDIDRNIKLADAARNEAQQAKDLCNQSLQEMQRAAHAEALGTEHFKRLEEKTRGDAKELQQILDHTASRMAPYSVDNLTVDSCSLLLSGLIDRQQKWRRQNEQEHLILADLQTLQIDLERETTLVQKQAAEIDRIGVQIRIGQDQLSALQKSRSEHYGDKDPERQEKRAADRRAEAEKNLAAVIQDLHLLENNRAVLDERLSSLALSLASRAEELSREERDFLLSISGNGFRGETDFNAARLPDEHIIEIRDAIEKLTKKEVENKTLLQSRQETQRQEIQKHQTELSVTDLTRQIEANTAALQALQQQIGMLQGRLQDNDEQRNRQHSRREALEKQRRECRRWLRLHELIGSSDGKKFRNFAQGVTFEMMVSHANHSLRKMTDRYILIRDVTQPLELNVIDNYQAGEIRSTKNLSGGESFIVSLSLALGLVGMASKNVQVDSLFLDEGFGTLDEDSLETALETLAGLQQDGKIIGIISHVPALQERIATRIQVTPGPAGRSRLRGPGITQM